MGFKSKIIIMPLVIILLHFVSENSFAVSTEIKSVMKINRMGSYVILINYETHEAWTDNLLFKVYCKFDEGEFIFTSASLNNVSQGWHKTEVGIPDVMKKRYGSLKEYKIELYRKGILVDTRNGY